MAFGLAEEAELEAMLDALAAGDPAGAFDALDAALAHGRDVEGVVDQLADHLRDCMVVALCGPDTPLVTVGGAVRERLKARARKASADAWMSMLGLLEEAAARMKRTDRPRIAAELALMRAGRMAHLIDLAALVEKLSEGAGWPGAAGTVSSGTELPSASGKAGGGLAPSPDAGGHRQPAPSLGEQARLRSAGETPEIARRQDVGSASSDERGGRQDVARGAVTASPPPALPRHVTETPPPARAAATAATPPAVTNGLASRWSAFLDGVRAKAPALGRSMGSARPVGFDGRVLELDVSAVGPLDLHVLTNMLETPEKRQLAESVAAGVFGTGVRLALAAAAPAEGSLWSPPAAPSRPAPAPKPVVLAPSPEAPPAATQGQNLLEHGEVKNWIRALKGKVVRNEW